MVGVAAYYARVILAAQRLYFAIGGLKNLRLSQGVISWVQLIKVTNGESVSIPITSANFENRINGSVIGKSILAGSQVIAARSISSLEILVTIPLIDLLALGAEIVNIARTGAVTIELTGGVRALGVNIPVNQKFSVDFKHLL